MGEELGRQLLNNADLWNVRERLMNPVVCVFYKTFSSSGGPSQWLVCGTGLLLRHGDELLVCYRCHVLIQLARNALEEKKVERDPGFDG